MLELLKNLLWNPFIVINLACIGLIILIKTKFYTIVKLPKIFKETIFSVKKGSHAFGFMCTSLGGTIGVGNAVGVAGAILEGGPGAVFWMGIAGIFGMAIKQAEVYYSIHHNKNNSGTIGYIEYSSGSKFFAILYALLTILVSFGMGNLAQIKTSTISVSRGSKYIEAFCALLIFFLFLFIILGGIEKIRRFSEIAVPIFALLYIILLFVILFRQRNHLQDAISEVIACSGIFSGIKWALIKNGITNGFSKAIFSSEAGLGSAGFPHCASNNDAMSQSKWAVVEVFIDSLICIMTALAILTCPKDLSLIAQTQITKEVFSLSLGQLGETFYSIAILFFAFSSLLCWYYNGSCAIGYITKNKNINKLYIYIFSAIILTSPFIADSAIIDFSDIANALMIYVNLSALWLLVLKKD